MKDRIGISLDEKVIDAIEEKRGLVPRSTYINDLLRQSLKLSGEKN